MMPEGLAVEVDLNKFLITAGRVNHFVTWDEL